MLTFYMTLGITYVTALVTRVTKQKERKLWAIIFVILTLIPFILVAGLRSGIGDTYFYKHAYSLLAENPSSLKLDGDFGFSLFSLLLIQFSTDPQLLIIVTSIITGILNISVLYKYCSYYELQIYMYITSGYFLVTMNGIRQSMVAAILFLASYLIIKGKFKTFVLVVLLVTPFHASALIMIPVYFIVRQEAWSKRVMQFMFIAILGVLLYNVISPILFRVLENTQYGHYADFNEGGSSIIRTIINAVPLALAYLKRDELKEAWPESNMFVNFSLINVIFVAFGMYNWIFNRFTIYFQLYNFVLLPFLIKNCFKGKEKRLLYIGLVAGYFVFFYIEHVIQLQMNYNSEYLKVEKIFYNVLP